MAMNKTIAILVIVLTSLATGPAWAAPVSMADAERAVIGWLNSDDAPLGASIGWEIEWTDAYCGSDGVVAYYIVYLLPSGFVIVAADDRIEPIVGFVSGYAYFDPSDTNALGALVSRDLPARIKNAAQLEQRMNQGAGWTTGDLKSRIGSMIAKVKWRKLKVSSDPMVTVGRSTISDVRVAPLMSATWGQDYVTGTNWYCYNYYTPGHYYDGCVATAMAQFMRYKQWPLTGIGRVTKTIRVGSVTQSATTRGGDGLGGRYLWNRMDLTPDSATTAANREAIGALCYDSGVAASMQYSSSGSGAYMHDARSALVNIFRYASAVMGGNEYSDIGAGLTDMVNPNLDAGSPVLLAIFQITNGSYGAGHAIVADGYGYNSSTLYHHLNMGWDGMCDAWYNLPNVNAGYAFNTVVACIYNIDTSAGGEIISGRVTHSSGVGVPGVVITATGTGGPYTTVTNANGIYALAHVQSNTAYTVNAASSGLAFDADKPVTTGQSISGRLTSGNKGGIDFATDSALPAAPAAVAAITYPATASGRFTVTWSASDDATGYELMRSLDSAQSWLTVYLGADTTYSENLPTGNYRYSVRALNPGGAADWTVGSYNCVVWTTVPPAPASVSYPTTNRTGSFRVSWSASAGATSYQAFRSNNNGSTWTRIYSGPDAYFTDTAPNGRYRYAARAVNSVGNSSLKISTVDCVVTAPPAMPASISYPLTTATGSFAIRWAASTGTTQYYLYRSTDGGTTWTKIWNGTALSCTQNLVNGRYRFQVKASNAYGTSAARRGTNDCVVTRP